MLTEELLKDYYKKLTTFESITQYINSIEDINFIISDRRNFEYYYDKTIDLISPCGFLAIETLKSLDKKDLSLDRIKGKNNYEDRLDLLITGITLANDIPSSIRLKIVIDLMPGDTRLIKASIIDSLVRLDDDIVPRILKDYINRYIDDDDLYIRKYAQEALKELIDNQ